MEAVVEFDYKAEQEDELNLKVGDVISNVQTAEGGWWEGELHGKKGMFPENFVKLVEKRKAASKKEDKQIATQRKSVRELANKFKDGNVPIGAPPKKKEKKKKCKVLFDYTKENDDELELTVGDIIDFHKQVEEGWWEGSLNGNHGVFPSNFVEMIEDSSEDPPAPPVPSSAPPPSLPEKEKTPAPALAADSKDGGFQSIKGKKVVGVGLGNIFGGGPIKLRTTSKDNSQIVPKKLTLESFLGDDCNALEAPVAGPATPPAAASEPDPGPEAVKREKSSSGERAVVRFSYSAEQPDELSLVEGQVIRILERDLEDEGWWKGEVNGKVGVFPDNFVDLLPEEPSKPKKPPPPSAASKQAYPKLPEKSQMGDGDDKVKNEHSAPVLSKKPQPPPPIGKKPLPAKPEAPLPARPAAVKPQSKSSTLPAGIPAPAPTASLNSSLPAPASKNTDNTEGQQFDDIEASGQKLTHLTASRAKGPKKRPPSTVLNLNEAELKEASPERPAQVEKANLPRNTSTDKPLPTPSLKDRYPTHTEAESPSLPVSQQPAPSHTHNSVAHHRDQLESSSGPPPRPPEPVAAHSSSSTSQMNKLIEQLQKDLQDLKANSVSKSSFNELKAEHEKLKSDFDNFKSNHTKKLREVIFEVDEEKKLRLTTQVEIERVKKWMAETNV